MNKNLLRIFRIILAFYILMCGVLFYFQENLIFFPQKLEKNYQFTFDQKFEEVNIKANDNVLLNGLLFKADSSKGLVFYLHGNAGSLSTWGNVAKMYTNLNYDVFMFDYRGYGKSEGSISSQKQLFQDLQIVYDLMKKRYSEDKIIVLGYSIGSGLAAEIASTNKPKLLILQAPYYSLTDLMRHSYPIIPAFILKYKFKTNEYIKDCTMPIVVFHGNQDEVIYYGSSLKLEKEFKTTDKLITLEGQEHNGMTDNPDYINEIRKILNGDRNTELKNKIIGIWTYSNSENATFRIDNDSIFYVDALESFKYTLNNDTLTIQYPDYTISCKVSFKDDTLLMNSDNETSKFWKFEN